MKVREAARALKMPKKKALLRADTKTNVRMRKK